jgi:hypothetical protein
LLKDAFIGQYEAKIPSLINSIELLSMRMAEDQTVQEYIKSLTKLFVRTKCGDDMKLQVFVSGLSPKLQANVISTDPKNFADACSAAVMFESLSTRKLEHSLKLENMIKKLSQEVAKLTINDREDNPRIMFIKDGQAPQDYVPMGERKCFRCSQVGHISRFCKNQPQSDTPRRPKPVKRCLFCNKLGHVLNECYQRINRQQSNNAAFCMYCSKLIMQPFVCTAPN